MLVNYSLRVRIIKICLIINLLEAFFVNQRIKYKKLGSKFQVLESKDMKNDKIVDQRDICLMNDRAAFLCPIRSYKNVF